MDSSEKSSSASNTGNAALSAPKRSPYWSSFFMDIQRCIVFRQAVDKVHLLWNLIEHLRPRLQHLSDEPGIHVLAFHRLPDPGQSDLVKLIQREAADVFRVNVVQFLIVKKSKEIC